MKTSFFILLLIALASTGLVAQKQTTPAIKKPQQILFDFRVDRASAPPKIPLATQKSVLSKVFSKYLTDAARCKSNVDASSDADPLKAARNAGQIVPSIEDMATGSFTGPLLSQTLYVISVGECNASHADNFGTKRVAIFSGAQLVADLDVNFKRAIVRKTDLNGDGVDELLMTSGDMNQGTIIEMAALVDFQNGRLRVIEDFGTVLEDSCPSLSPGSSSKAALISLSEVATGKMPRLAMENYEATCRKAKRWRFVSAGKMSEP